MGDGLLLMIRRAPRSTLVPYSTLCLSNIFVTIRGNNKHTYRLGGAMPPNPSSLSSSLLSVLLTAVLRGPGRGEWRFVPATPPRRGGGFHCRPRRPPRRRGCWCGEGVGG